MAKILAPNKVYAGVSAGVQFKDGTAETTHPYLIDWFREHGYTVVEAVEPVEAEAEPEVEVHEVDGLEGEALDDELPEEAEVQVEKPAKVKAPRRTVRKVR